MAKQLTAPVHTTLVEPMTEQPSERVIREAVERVYRNYGSDLSAFERQVRKDLEKLSNPKAEER